MDSAPPSTSPSAPDGGRSSAKMDSGGEASGTALNAMPSASDASKTWTPAVARNKKGDIMRSCPQQKRVASYASLDNFFK